MKNHKFYQEQLYDFIKGTLAQAEHDDVEKHLESCPQCVQDYGELKELLTGNELQPFSPSDHRPAEYWNSFYSKIGLRILEDKQSKPKLVPNLVEKIYDLVSEHRLRYMSFAAAFTVLITGYLIFWTKPELPQSSEVAGSIKDTTEQAIEQRLERYFSKSKVLLVGLSNMKVDKKEPVDLSVEQNVSRELLQEARYLSRFQLPDQSSRLIGDLERIQYDLMNIGQSNTVPGIEIIRSGIERENLLFKVRMAESAYRSRLFKNVSVPKGGDSK